MKPDYATCQTCLKRVTVRLDGSMRAHSCVHFVICDGRCERCNVERRIAKGLYHQHDIEVIKT
jgi:hypothetical protein